MGQADEAAWLKVLAPAFLSWLAGLVFLEPVISRRRAAPVNIKKESTGSDCILLGNDEFM